MIFFIYSIKNLDIFASNLQMLALFQWPFNLVFPQFLNVFPLSFFIILIFTVTFFYLIFHSALAVFLFYYQIQPKIDYKTLQFSIHAPLLLLLSFIRVVLPYHRIAE